MDHRRLDPVRCLYPFFNFMIINFFVSLVTIFLRALCSVLPAWTLWPAIIETGFRKFSGVSWWLDPWIPMRDFWGAILCDAGYLIFIFLPIIIFSRAARVKLLGENHKI